MHARVVFETDAHKGLFWASVRTTRKAILTDARNGLVGNGCAQGMGQSLMRATYIPDARNPFNHIILAGARIRSGCVSPTGEVKGSAKG